jgi:hypothetical protein
MRLLAVEVRRFWARRAVAVVLLLTVAAAALLAGSTIWSTRGATEAETTAAQQQLTVESRATRGDYQECLADPPPRPDDATAAERCRELDPQIEWFLPRDELDLAAQLASSGFALTLILTGAAIVAGATFAGSDWSSGALSTQLLHRPRRARLWTAKALAVVIGVTVTAVVVVGTYWLTLGLVAQARGLPLGADLVQEIGLQGARAAVLAAAGGLGAFALAMALRSTTATLSLLFAYAVAGEALWGSVPVEKASQWSLALNLKAWVLDGTAVFDESICSGSPACETTYVLSASHGGIYLAVLVGAAVLLSLVTFLRRDVP